MAIDLSALSAKEAVTAIYAGYFDRAPDPSGLNYWIGELESGNLTLAQIATSFSTQIESTTEYPFFLTPNVASAQAFLTQVYVNLFNRGPDAAGLSYWTNELVSGNQPVGQIILSIISGATNSAAGNDIDTIMNKIEVGCDWVQEAADAGINAVPFTDDPEAVAGAKDALDGVTDDPATVTAAKLETDAFIAGYGNDDPITTPKTVNANEDATLNNFVEATDPDGDALTYAVAPSGTTSNGTLVMNTDGSFVYTPNANFVGSDSFTYSVSDGQGGSATGTVTIIVNNTNDAPVASNVVATTAEDNAVTVVPAFTDIDAGDTATFSIGSNPANGTVVVNANGTFTYTPDPDFNGQDSFQYIVTDAAGATSIATAEVTVTAVDDAPVANDSAAAANEGGAVVNGTVSASDIDSGSISFAVVGAAPAGLTFNNNGTFSFDPTVAAYNSLDEGDTEVLTVNFTATADGQSDTGTLTITVTGTNDAPTASAVTATGAEDGGAITVTAITADVDADDTATFSVSANPANGTVVNNGNGTFTYTPNANFNGTDSFQYTVTDSQGASASAAATITVTSVNDAPVLADESVSSFEDEVVTGQLTATDVDGDTLTYAVAQNGGPNNGALTLNADGSYTYTPNADFNGTDSFTVVVNDGNGGVDTATVTLNIAPVDDVLTVAIDDIAGGTGDDLFLGNGQTLNPGDSIDGGDGDDTLFVATTGANILTAFLTSNLENFVITTDTALGGGNQLTSVDFSSTSGILNTGVVNSTQPVALRFIEVINGEVNVQLDNLTSSTNVLIDGRNSELGVAGTQSLNLTVGGSQTTNPDTGIVAVDTGFEVVNIDTTNAPSDGVVNMARLRTDSNTDGGIPLGAEVAGSGASTVNIDADDAALVIGNADAGAITRNSTDAVMGIDNPLSAGVTTVDASASSAGVTVSVKNAQSSATVNGGSAGDNLEGSDNGDVINGNGGNDNIAGEGGNDDISGGDGADYITGQAGNDSIDGDAGADIMYGNAGNDSQLGGTGNDFIDTGSNANGAGTEFVDAGADNDTVVTRGEFLNGRAVAGTTLTPNGVGANNNVDQLSGGDGIDSLTVNGTTADTAGLNDVQQFETIFAQSGSQNFLIGNNSVFETDHDARVAAGGADGSTTINGTNSTQLTVNATTLDEGIELIGGDGNDVLLGGRGDDTIEGDGDSGTNNGGNDNMQGGLGDDTFVTSASELDGGDSIEGDGGDDTILITNEDGRTGGLGFFSSGNAALINGNVSGIETIKVQDEDDVNDEGDLTINFVGFDNVDNVNIFHDGVFGGADNPRVHVDGSDMDANERLTVDVSANGVGSAPLGTDTDFEISGGAGADTFIMGSFLDSGDAIDGGDGFDEVIVSRSAPGDFSNVSNIECITVSAMATGTLEFGADAEAAFAAGVTPIIKLAPGSTGLTIDTTAFTGPVIIEDNDGSHTFNTGGGADTIVSAEGTDTFNTGGGDDVIVVSGTDLDITDVVNTGGGNDTVLMDNEFGAVNAVSNLDTNATVENYVLTDDGDRFTNIFDGDDNTLEFQNGDVNTLTTINVDATALTDPHDSFTVTLNANQDDADFAFDVEGSSTRDTFVKNNKGVDNNIDFDGNDGNDNFVLSGSDAGSTTEYDGGDGFDTLTLNDNDEITDDGFVSMENIENLDALAGVEVNARLGAEADEAGLEQITGSDEDDDVETDSQFNNDLFVTPGGGDDNLDFGASSGTITFFADAGDIDANDTLLGGTGADDVFLLRADNNTADLSTTKNVETIIVAENGDADIGITITDDTFDGVADGEIDVDASALDDTDGNEGGLTLNAGGVSGPFVLDVIGGTGDDDITTGGGNDTVSSGDGDDIVNSNDGDDTVLLGDGDDVAFTGAGEDVVDAGDDDDYVDAGENDDVVNGGDGDDTIIGGDHDTDLGEVLTGGEGDDQFNYVNIDDSRGLVRDIITDFDQDGDDCIAIETQLIFQSIVEIQTILPLIPMNASLATPFNPTAGINFAGVASSFGDAQGAISLNSGDGKADYVLELNAGPNGESKLWVDMNDDGVLNGRDLQIFLPGTDASNFGNGEVKIIDTIGPVISDVALSVDEVRLAVNTVRGDFDQTSAGDETDVYESLTGTDTTLEGMFDGIDTDGTAVTYEEVNGVTPVAGTITVAGTYGTITVDQATGAYTYEVGATAGQRAAIEALDDLDSPVDSFTITIEDNAGNRTDGTFEVTVNGADDNPVVVAGGGSATFTEDEAIPPALSGQLVATDVDTGEDAVLGDENGDTVVFNPTAGSTEEPDGTSFAHVITGPDINGDATIEGAYGTLSINVNTGVYSYAPGATANQLTNIQWLAAVETHNEAFTIDVFDGDDAGAVTTVITATWNGDNDRPTLTVAAPDNGDWTENQANPALTFSVNVVDVDHDDTVDVEVTSVALASTGAAPTDAVAAAEAQFGGTAAANAAMLALLTGGPVVGLNANPTTGDNLTFTFHPAAPTFDFLADGEVLELTYTIEADDNRGLANSTHTDTVTIRVEGTNDAPSIDVIGVAGDNNSGTLNELPGSVDLLPGVSDTVTVTDVDVNDELAVSISLPRATMVDSGAQNGVTTVITAGLQADIDAAVFAAVPNPAVAGVLTTEQLTWSFTPAAGSQFDELQAGDTLTIEYDITVNDGNGGSALETISIIIVGTNDLPVIDSATNPADIPEIAGDSSAQDIPQQTGTITVTDLDVGDALTFSVTGNGVADLNLAGSPTEAGPFPGPNSSTNADSVAASIAELTNAARISFANDVSNGGATTSDWYYNPNATDLDWLRQGDTLTITFTAQVDDGLSGPSGAQNLVITITGTNDVPTIDTATNPAPIAEIAGDSSAQDIPQQTGTITVTDQDLGDTLTFSVTGNGVASLNGGVSPTEAGPFPGANSLTNADSVAASIAELTNAARISFQNDTSNGEDTTSEWYYNPNATDLDWLRQGDTLTITFVAQVDDGQGNVGAQNLVISITGTNDVPVISAATNPVAISEVAGDSSAQVIPATAGGTFTVTDQDLNDTLSYSANVATATWNTGGPNTTLTAPPLSASQAADIATLTAAGNLDFTGAPGTTNGEDLQVAFSYSTQGNDVDLDWLNDGESLTLAYTVTVTDGAGATATQAVTVTINGTNDAPVISLQASDLAAVSLGETNAPLVSANTLTVRDADINDSIVTTAVSSVAIDPASSYAGPNTPSNADLLAMLTAVTAPTTADPAEVNNLTWTFDSSSLPTAFDFLADNETLILDYVITVTDDSGATDTQTVTVTINGNNDNPVFTIGAGDAAAAGVLETDAPLTASDTLTVTDVDDADTVLMTSNGVTSIAGTYAGGSTPSNAVLDAMFTVAPVPAIPADLLAGAPVAPSNVTWTWTSAPETFDFLSTGETLELTYEVQADDGQGGITMQPVVITITGTNDAPVAVADSGSTDEDTILNVAADGILGNDTDVDEADTHTVQDFTIGATTHAIGSTQALGAGQLTVNADGSYSFDPNGGYESLAVGETATETFTYTVVDNGGLTDTATVTITINGADDAPVASGVFSATITELPDGDPNELTQIYSQQLSVTFTDPDTNDVVTFSSTPVVFPTFSGTHSALTVIPGSGNPAGPFTYEIFSQGDGISVGALDSLAEGETEIVTRTFTGTGTGGLSTDQVLTYTYVGANDGPEVTAAAVVTGTNISFTVSDVDLIDVLSLVGGPINGTDASVSGVATSITAIAQGVATADAIEVQDNIGATTGVLLNLTQGTAGGDVLGVAANGVAGAVFGFGGADNITGSALNDTIDGGTGADVMAGGAGADTFVINAGDGVVAAASVAGLDQITDIDFDSDLIDLDVAVANVNTAVAAATVNEATFVTDMNTFLSVAGGVGFDTAVAGDISAALVAVTAGDQAGKTFLAIDVDGDDAFTTADYAIDVTGLSGTLDTGDFI